MILMAGWAHTWSHILKNKKYEVSSKDNFKRPKNGAMELFKFKTPPESPITYRGIFHSNIYI